MASRPLSPMSPSPPAMSLRRSALSFRPSTPPCSSAKSSTPTLPSLAGSMLYLPNGVGGLLGTLEPPAQLVRGPTSAARRTSRGRKRSTCLPVGRGGAGWAPGEPRRPRVSAPGGGALVDGHVQGAGGGEGLALPAAPAVAEAEPAQACHQVELGGPRVAQDAGHQPRARLAELDLLRDQALRHRVEPAGRQHHRVGVDALGP